MKAKNVFKLLLLNVLIISTNISCAQPAPSGEPPKNITVQSNYVDLTYAAEQTVNAVVHIKTEFMRKNSVWDEYFGEDFGRLLEELWGSRSSQYPVMATGSGVIIDPTGYIVTNNHVVQEANQITVTLNNKREYEATVVGTDPQTDLALIKINAQNLPYLVFANSDEVRVGEWVLAVGNPFNLNSTVTAGIVSAKARNLNILGDQSSIESFIQTDAAVNKGNSGGALVNAAGDLIGINSAIASGNGYFTGYSFAVPSNIAKKIVNDLKEFGTVKRAYLGVFAHEVNNKMAEELNMNEIKGIYIVELVEDGSAKAGGLQVGDIILDINNHDVNSMSELREVLTQYSPGDKVTVNYLRKNSERKTEIVLK